MHSCVRACRQLQTESVEYKKRAAKVLAAKEVTIGELTEKLQQLNSAEQSSASSAGGGNASSSVSIGDLIQLRQERDALREELDEAASTIEQLRANVADLESRAEEEAREMQSSLEEAEEQLGKERERTKALNHELSLLTQEVTQAKEERERANATLDKRSKEHAKEVEKLKRKLTLKSSTTDGQDEVENRLRQMTEHLLQKQTQVDALNSEIGALQLRLEAVLQQRADELQAMQQAGIPSHRVAQASSSSSSNTVQNERRLASMLDDEERGYDHDEGGPRMRALLTLAPNLSTSSSGVARMIVSSANWIDNVRYVCVLVRSSRRRTYPINHQRECASVPTTASRQHIHYDKVPQHAWACCCT